MISHKHKCIFIHIPSTSGTYIENLFNGDSTLDDTRHLSIYKYKEMYHDYWDSYFKFTIVRNACDVFPNRCGG